MGGLESGNDGTDTSHAWLVGYIQWHAEQLFKITSACCLNLCPRPVNVYPLLPALKKHPAVVQRKAATNPSPATWNRSEVQRKPQITARN